MDPPEVQYARSHGASIAYQLFGDGPATIVAVPPLAQNIELAWEWPGIASMLRRFGAFSRYLHFDKRGTGMSDRRFAAPGVDQRVDDLRAVMDDAGIERAHLFGVSEGGPMTLLFAATYPQRVEGLILESTAARLVPETAEQAGSQRAAMEFFVSVWGTADSITADVFAPSLAGDKDFRRWHQRYERQAADPSTLWDLLEMNGEMDAREVLPEIRCPVLMFHRVDDPVVPIDLARATARALPDARLVEEPGSDHFSYAADVEPMLAEIERFTTGRIDPSTPPVSPTGAPEVEIGVLGTFEVVLDGRAVATADWGSRLARQLCKRLVLARGWPVTRDELIDLLWPNDEDLRRLGARLSVQLSAVRRLLRGGVIADRSTVRLDLDEVSTDLERFMEAPDDESVVANCPGQLLPDDVFEDWTAALRDEVRARFVAAAKGRASEMSDSGDHQTALGLAARILAEDGYDEATHHAVVRAHHALGQHGQARSAYRRYASSMAEIGVEVGPTKT